VLHASQSFRYFDLIHAGDRLTFTSRIANVFQKKGRHADIRRQAHRRHQSARRARGRDARDARRPRRLTWLSRSIRSASAMSSRRSRCRRSRRETLALYAGASRDHKPIHVDVDFARAAGMPDVVAHGMLSMAWLAGC
jgi:acyl dehydratase